MPKDERVRFYREPHDVYLLVLVGNGKSPSGMYDCIGEVRYPGDVERPALASSQVSPNYLRHRCKRVTWDELPEVWQREFERYIEAA